LLVIALGPVAACIGEAQVFTQPSPYTLCQSPGPAICGVPNVPTREYYYPTRTPGACFKAEAIRLMETPWMNAQAAAWSADPRVQEIVVAARGVEVLVYDGFRLVRTHGVLDDLGPIDDLAAQRVSFYFGVTMSEARAWLVASRLLQIGRYGSNGALEEQLEQELANAAGDIALRVKTYFGDAGVVKLMPRFAATWGYRVPTCHYPSYECHYYNVRRAVPVGSPYPEVCTPVGRAALVSRCGSVEWEGRGE